LLSTNSTSSVHSNTSSASKRNAEQEAAGAPHQKVPGFVIGGGKNASVTNYFSPKGGSRLPLGSGIVSAPHIASCKQPLNKSGQQKEIIKIDQNAEEEEDEDGNDLDGSN